MRVFQQPGRSRLGGLFAAAAVSMAGLLASAAPAEASAFFQNYQVNAAFDMSSIVLYQTTATGGGTTNSFDVQAPSTLITDPFVKTDPITGTYFLGVSTLGSEDEEPALHLVLALNNSFAAFLIGGGQDFEDIFAGYDESSLIGALTTLSDGSSTQVAIDNASDLLFSFSETVAADQGLFGSTDTFSMVSFSTASAFGDGTSFITEAGVPEPAAWALMILGFGGAGAMLRRRRAGVATA